ncbi:MAG TPA: LacI family DNA-binding transcriptional regulator [Roseiarcus sp.]|jgi:LacI family transcriptional regulator|nr:LacI family DNA-binding transcriptional regulator [Roseiarcus sp.]
MTERPNQVGGASGAEGALASLRRNGAGRSRGPTMTEVAAAAGVSQTTVSLVLNAAQGARLSSETRERVFVAAQRLGYRLARRGAPAQSTIGATAIGFVVNEMSTDPWTAIAMDGARDKAWEHGLTISAAVTRGDAEMEQAVLAQLTAQPLLGLIYGTIHTRRIAAPPALYRLPTILLNCYVPDRSLPSVIPGEVGGGDTATRRLIRAGHRRIGYINGEALMDASRDRLKGYRHALASADLPYDPDLVRPGNWEPSAGYGQTLALMRLSDPPTAIFCANDLMAVGSIEALKELGRRVPEDVAVMGYDDREIAQFTHPPLTTVLLPHFEMGAEAAAYLINHARRPPPRPAQIKIECPLIERKSVGPARAEIET